MKRDRREERGVRGEKPHDGARRPGDGCRKEKRPMLDFTILFRTDDEAVFAYGEDVGRGERIEVSFRRYDGDGRCTVSWGVCQPRTMDVENLQVFAIRRLGIAEGVREWHGDSFWARAGRAANMAAESVYEAESSRRRRKPLSMDGFAIALADRVAKEMGFRVKREPFMAFIHEIAEAWWREFEKRNNEFRF